MNEQTIKNLISSMLNDRDQSNQYGMPVVPYHIHNGVDSPFLSPQGSTGPTVYTGFVHANGTKGTPFPTGWSVAHSGTGQYAITHNLGTSAYTVQLQMTNFTVTVVSGVASTGSTQIGIYMIDIQNFAPPYNFRDQDFFFSVIVP